MLVREKVDSEASSVLAAMLSLSRPHEAKLREERSPPLPEAEIMGAVAEAAQKEGGGQQPDPALVPQILRRLTADTSEARRRTRRCSEHGQRRSVHRSSCVKTREIRAHVPSHFTFPTAPRGTPSYQSISDRAFPNRQPLSHRSSSRAWEKATAARPTAST